MRIRTSPLTTVPTTEARADTAATESLKSSSLYRRPHPRFPATAGSVTTSVEKTQVIDRIWFQTTLDYLAEHSRELNWQLLYAGMPQVDMSKALYADELQVAFPVELVETMRPQYKEFETVNIMLKEMEELH